MSVRAKLAAAFGGLTLLVVVIAAVAVTTLAEANDRFEGFIHGINARSNLTHLVREDVAFRAIAARNLVLVDTAQDIELEKTAVNKAHADVTAHLKQLNDMARDPGVSEQARQMIGEIDKIEQQYATVALSIVDMALNHRRDEAIAKMNRECRPLLAALVKITDEYAAYNVKQSTALVDAATADYGRQRNLLLGGCVIALLASAVAGVLITRSLTRALGAEPADLCAAVAQVADGDLTAALHVHPGDTGSVMAAVARMQQALTRVVASVRQGADRVSAASAEIAQGNMDLSGRTESQASALEETAASMEELSSTVRQNADNARQANQLAQNASNVAVQGGQVVAQVVDTMKGISDSSRKIADIINVIDGIAFQTNILALNAAVEAARAGEQGRGFAVVAGEVRSLAQRSAEAAKEIKGLITDSVTRVEEGSTLVDQAGTTMNDVVASIRRVTDIVGEISAASAEQSAGVSQVGEAVTQMDHATQQNAALVEEMSAAATALRSQSDDLVHTVAVFKLGPSSAVTAAPSARAAVPAQKALPAQQRPVLANPKPKKRSLNDALPSLSRPAIKAPALQAVGASADGGAQGWDSF